MCRSCITAFAPFHFPAVDFFNEVSLLYGTVSEFCSKASCPTMSAGSRFEYLWADGVAVTKPMKVSAPEYVDFLMTWVEGQINNERLFPTSTATPFPRDFKSIVSNIFKRLFRGLYSVFTIPHSRPQHCSSHCVCFQFMHTSTTPTLRKLWLWVPRGT